MDTEKLQSYADILLTRGVALATGQPLLINADIEYAPFVRILTERAYTLGASDVTVNWTDGAIRRQRLLHASESRLDAPSNWIRSFYENQIEDGACIISLVSANPRLLEGVPVDRIARNNKATGQMLKFWRQAVMSSQLRWCVAAAPTLLWADLIGISGTDSEKIDTLWDMILRFARIHDVDESETFTAHMERLSLRTQAMNQYNFHALHFKSDHGTDLMLELAKNHIWMGGAEADTQGTLFNANIPTEEVFSAPARYGVNGTVRNTKPLSYQGHTIDGFTLTFKDGKVVAFSAEEGEETLRELLHTDERSAYLGEVALVDHFSPISLSETIFYETLFDENASCHLAFGAAYPICLKNGTEMTEDELLAAGLNQSITHVDFMIGDATLSITGLTADGQRVPVMEKGRLLL